jgi:hypothetical protein
MPTTLVLPLSPDRLPSNGGTRSTRRTRLCRLRKRRGELLVTISVTRSQVQRLKAQGYEFDAAVRPELAQALETFIMDFLS